MFWNKEKTNLTFKEYMKLRDSTSLNFTGSSEVQKRALVSSCISLYRQTSFQTYWGQKLIYHLRAVGICIELTPSEGTRQNPHMCVNYF